MKRSILVVSVPLVIALLAITINFSCSKNNGSGSPGGPGGSTGKDSVLVNIGNNIILPHYQAFASYVNSLDSAILNFNATPDVTKLGNVQAIFRNAYTAWQTVSAFDGFGPAYSAQPTLSSLNLFPTTASRIDSNILSGNDNVNAFANASAKGFPALDYLLFGAGGGTLANFTTDASAANRRSYLAAVSADIKNEANAALTGWSAGGGNYINTFIDGTGNSVSSSLGLLINSVDQDFEVLKNDCLGIPLGKQPPGQILPVLPKEVEAYYSGISVQLALANLLTAQTIYLGYSTQGPRGPGLKQYLVQVNAKYNGGPLADTIAAHFTAAIAALQAVPDPLSATIQNDPAGANAAYVQIQQLVVLLKTDMPSSLGVLITYGDNDGD
jgi:predicted lipoprotein